MGHPRQRTGAAACVLQGRLYLVGGFSSDFGALQSVISISKEGRQQGEWRKEGSMTCRREGVAACAYEDSLGFGSVVALGGSNGTGILATAEKATSTLHEDGKDSELNHFIDLPDMPIKRANATAAALRFVPASRL